jgi:hypothetical protein
MTINITKPNEAISEAGSERRAFHRALLETSGCLSDGIRKLDCIVLDLSLGGAMVKIDTSGLGETGTSEDIGEELIVTLEIEALVLLSAEVVWRRGSVLGLKFLQDPDEVANGLEHLLPPECFKGLAGRDIPVPLG